MENNKLKKVSGKKVQPDSNKTPKMKKTDSSDLHLQTKGGSLWKDIRSIYKFKEILGGGHFGTVRTGYKKQGDPNKLVAIKSISKKNINQKDLDEMINEVECLSMMDHPNIIKFYETYNDEYYFHIVMSLCKGKDVFDKIIEEGSITEINVSTIIYKVLSAITYCHEMGICHRDIKPENILFENENNEGEIKIIDFGLSKKYDSQINMQTVLGTPYYVAPEVLKGNYNQKCDVWSIGIFTYVMLSGQPPFGGKNNNDIFNSITNSELTFPSKYFNAISEEGIDFIKKCLVKDPKQRMLAKEAISHKWFYNISAKIHCKSNLDPKILTNLKEFSYPEKFKKLVLKFLVNEMSNKEISKLREVFRAMDLDKTGFISNEELEKGFKTIGMNLSKEELADLIKKIDNKNNGKIDYSEFLLAAMDFSNNVDKEKLASAFSYFDIDDTGFISISNIEDAFLRFGMKIVNKEELNKIIEEVAGCGQKKITLHQFMKMFDKV